MSELDHKTVKEIFLGDELFAALVAVAAMAAYLPTLSGGFFWDLPLMMRGDSLFVPFFEFTGFRPLAWLSFSLDRMLWDLWAPGYHLLNLFLHASNSVMLMFIARRIGLTKWSAAVAAALFALHPANAEAVGWVLGRIWLLAAFFSLASFLLYLRYVSERLIPAAVASALFFLLALLCAKGAMVLPLLVLLHCRCVGFERKKTLLVALMYMVALVFYHYYFLSQGGRSLGDGLEGGSNTGGMFDAFAAMGYYLFKLIVPLGLKVFPHIGANVGLSIAGIVPVFALYVLYTEGLRAEAAVLAALIVLFLPALGVAMAGGPFPLGFRYAYLPAAAFCILVVQWIGRIAGPDLRRTATGLLLAAFAVGALFGAFRWADPEAIWAEISTRRPNMAMLHVNHAATLMRDGRTEQGSEALARALASDDVSEDHFALIMSIFQGTGADGEKSMFEALVSVRGEASALYVMGFIYYNHYISDKNNIENLRTAVDYLERAVKSDDFFYRAHYYLGKSYIEAREFLKARAQLLKARETDVDRRYTEETDELLTIINGLSRIGLKNIPVLQGWVNSPGG